MMQSAASTSDTSSISSSLVGEQVTITFLDIDDTAIALHSLEIKNAHLLLPILLYLNVSNQPLGFMTNRPPTDDINPYKVSWLREDLLEFGIEITHIVFGGGPEKNQIKVEESRAVALSLGTLNKLFDALKLSDMGSEQLKEMNALIKRLDDAKFEGKNNHILEFLGSCFDQAKNSYSFANRVCVEKNKLKFILVDDLANIAAATSLLGTSFVGIQASRGGNIPKVEDPLDDFYTVSYLHKLAAEVGLQDYANSLVSDPHKHKHDNPMMQLAALLYQWQKNKESCSPGRFKMLAAQITDVQCEQILGMMEYMMQMKHHPQAGYKSVDELLPIFNDRVDSVFLANAMRRFSVLEKRIASLNAPVVDEDNPAPVEKEKKSSSFLVRLASRGKSSAAPPVVATSSSTNLLYIHQDVKKMIGILENKKKALVDKITQLASSNNVEIARDAQFKLLSISSRSSDAMQSASSSSSSSPSSRASMVSASSTSASVSSADQAIVEQRRSFTPAASSGRSIGALREVSSADSLTALEARAAETPLDKPKKERSKRSGSNK